MAQLKSTMKLPSKKTSVLNKSCTVSNKLNSSKSLVRKSIITCKLKETNAELAKSLGHKEQELCELRKENVRLIRENYEMTFTYQFRKNNYANFLNNYYVLANAANQIFENFCELSDGLVAIKNHPFLAEEPQEVHNTSVPPSPFLPRDKIPRSPLTRTASNDPTTVGEVPPTGSSNMMNQLADKISSVRNQSLHSIHNLSVSIHPNVSMKMQSSLNQSHFNQSQLNLGKSRSSMEPRRVGAATAAESSILNISADQSLSRPKTSISKLSILVLPDPIVTPRSEGKVVGSAGTRPPNKVTKRTTTGKLTGKGSTKTKKTRKQKQQLDTLKSEPNREEYLRKKQVDAYYISFNETANATALPDSLNEFKNQLADTTETTVPGETASQHARTSDENQLSISKKRNAPVSDSILEVDDDDDDDDFIKPRSYLHKNKLLSSNSSISINEENRPKTKTKMSAISNPVSGTSAAAPKKRGRKRKVSKSEKEPNTTKAKAGPGQRKKKMKLGEENIETEIEDVRVVVEAPTGSGTIPIEQENDENKENTTSNLKTSTKTTSKKPRKPKTKQSESDEAATANTEPISKRSARHKKVMDYTALLL